VDQKRAILRSIVQRVDVVAEPTGVLQQRGERGHLAGSGGPRWAVRRVTFQLTVPDATAPPAPVEDGDRQLVTTSCHSDQLPVTENGSGDGHLVTTY
jgi:hypothetical protein